MRVLTKGLDKELMELLTNRRVSKVDIATAWATEGDALNALEDHKKRRIRQLTVRTMAGYSGNHTTPGALKRLAKLGNVRLVDGQDGMFHVKLFLFHGPGGSVAWVGSANFTGPGFGGNEELLYETKVTAKLQEWFDRRWKEIGAQSDQPAAYCKRWKKPEHPLLGVDPDPKKQGRQPDRHATDEPKIIVFVQKGKRPPPAIEGGNGKRVPAGGEVRIDGKRFPYEAAQECLKIVLEALQQEDQRFLAKCEKDRRFHRGKNSHYIAQREAGLGNKRFREYSQPIGESGWFFSTHTQTQEKWKLIEAAADVAGLKVEVKRLLRGKLVNGKMWQAETRARREVGF